jgi:glucose-1-phosphate thymidylyltransferase
MAMARKGVILVAAPPTAGARPVNRRPTVLEPVANRPIVSHVLDALGAASVNEVVVVAPDRVVGQVHASVGDESPAGVPVRYVVHQNASDVPDALRSAALLVGDASCIVHRGDGLLSQPLAPLADQFEQAPSDLMLLVHPAASQSDRLGIRAQRLLRIAELDSTRTSLGIAGVCLFGPGALSRAGDAGVAADADFDPAGLADAISRAGGHLDVQAVRGWRYYSGDASDLLELNRATLDTLSPDCERPRDGDNQIEGRVAIHETASVTSSVIVGPVIIGAGARVADAYVGPYTSIGAGARIEGVEVERSIISPGASITHLGARLVASVVGTNARIYRDFSLPRAMRLRCGDDVEVALC